MFESIYMWSWLFRYKHNVVREINVYFQIRYDLYVHVGCQGRGGRGGGSDIQGED